VLARSAELESAVILSEAKDLWLLISEPDVQQAWSSTHMTRWDIAHFLFSFMHRNN
jgi:hypothetical protein